VTLVVNLRRAPPHPSAEEAGVRLRLRRQVGLGWVYLGAAEPSADPGGWWEVPLGQLAALQDWPEQDPVRFEGAPAKPEEVRARLAACLGEGGRAIGDARSYRPDIVIDGGVLREKTLGLAFTLEAATDLWVALGANLPPLEGELLEWFGGLDSADLNARKTAMLMLGDLIHAWIFGSRWGGLTHERLAEMELLEQVDGRAVPTVGGLVLVARLALRARSVGG
jgi:hypothetical protein